MEIQDKTIILTVEDDFELCNLIKQIVKIKYGDFRIKIKNSKPYQLTEIQKSILLIKES